MNEWFSRDPKNHFLADHLENLRQKVQYFSESHIRRYLINRPFIYVVRLFGRVLNEHVFKKRTRKRYCFRDGDFHEYK